MQLERTSFLRKLFTVPAMRTRKKVIQFHSCSVKAMPQRGVIFNFQEGMLRERKRQPRNGLKLWGVSVDKAMH
jgi:hypothetical protein